MQNINHSHTEPQHWPALKMNMFGEPRLIAEGFGFLEGPVWDKSRELLFFSDISGNTIYRLSLPHKIDIVRKPSHNANGLALDTNGRLLAAEHGSRSVTRMEADGTVHTIASHYLNNRFHSPNDIAVRSDGTLYFTDPPFGLGMRSPEMNFMGLYRMTPEGELILEGKYNHYPNGVALSPDEKILYVALTAADCLMAYDVSENGSVSKPRKLADTVYPDGIAIDLEGNIYVAALEGIDVFESDGTPVGTIFTPRQPANCAFGGTNGKILFVTARDSLYQIGMPIPGLK